MREVSTETANTSVGDWTYRPSDWVAAAQPNMTNPYNAPPSDYWTGGTGGAAVFAPLITADPILAAKFERLMMVLGLSAAERAFVNAIAAGETLTWGVYADWLEDQGRTADAERARKAYERTRSTP